jgi:mRNA interferase MazF
MPERGDLRLIPFPFTDLSAAKRRPVLAVTAADRYGDFIALPVTSRPQAEDGLPITNADLVRGSLPAASWIRTNRIVTLNYQPGGEDLRACLRTDCRRCDRAVLRLYRLFRPKVVNCPGAPSSGNMILSPAHVP